MVNWTFGDVRQGGNGIVCDASQLSGVTASLFQLVMSTLILNFIFFKKEQIPHKLVNTKWPSGQLSMVIG